jgi:hypothetical protein
MSGDDDAFRAYNEARARGARHLAAAIRARRALETGDEDGHSFPGARPLVMVPRRAGRNVDPPTGFLVSFAGGEHDVVFRLKRGLTRVGRGLISDFELPKGVTPPVEGRQWLVTQRRGQALVVDDQSTNESVVLPHDRPRVEGGFDPRFDDGAYAYGEIRKSGAGITLDWAATTVHELHEGDVLLTCYAALVYGELAREA